MAAQNRVDLSALRDQIGDTGLAKNTGVAEQLEQITLKAAQTKMSGPKTSQNNFTIKTRKNYNQEDQHTHHPTEPKPFFLEAERS